MTNETKTPAETAFANAELMAEPTTTSAADARERAKVWLNTCAQAFYTAKDELMSTSESCRRAEGAANSAKAKFESAQALADKAAEVAASRDTEATRTSARETQAAADTARAAFEDAERYHEECLERLRAAFQLPERIKPLWQRASYMFKSLGCN